MSRGGRKSIVMNVEQGFTRHDAAPDHGAAEPVQAPARRWLLWIGGLVLLALIVGAVVLWRRGDAAPLVKTPELPRVTVIVPGRQAIASVISTTGSLAARREMPVGIAGEGGMVSRVLVEAGQWVAAGQTLATIERSVQVQESAALGASISVAEADAALAQSELDRAKQLVGRGFISKADVDRRTATWARRVRGSAGSTFAPPPPG
jgi:HlyD family secretion protein